MLEKGDVVIWDSSETVYQVGDKGFEAYLIVEGTVDILTGDGLRLSRLGKDEIFGETSLLLQTTRSVSVCLLYTSPSPRDATLSRMPSSA